MQKKVIKQIKVICTMFLWSGKDAGSRKVPVAWDKLCDPKNAGKLNVTSLIEWNQAYNVKASLEFSG